jgi:hypothetical protein
MPFDYDFVKTTEEKDSLYNRIILAGGSGSGKTWVATSFPNIFVIDSDRGLGGAAHAGRKFPYFQINAYDKAYNQCMEVMKAIKAGSKDFADIRYLVFDSLTSLSDLMELELVKFPRQGKTSEGEEVMSLPDFRVHRRRLINLLRFAQDLPVNIIYTVNTNLEKDELTGQIIESPSVAGRQAPKEMTQFANEVYYLEYDDARKEYIAWTKPHKWFRQSKTRFGLPERVVNPVYDTLAPYFAPVEAAVAGR